MKTTITKSRAGHYTVTVRDDRGQVVHIEGKLSLEQARAVAEKFKQDAESQKAQEAYMKELVAEIVANGNPQGDFKEELKAAHARRRAFAQEMIDGTSTRAKMAAVALCASVYAAVQTEGTMQRAGRMIEALAN